MGLLSPCVLLSHVRVSLPSSPGHLLAQALIVQNGACLNLNCIGFCPPASISSLGAPTSQPTCSTNFSPSSLKNSWVTIRALSRENGGQNARAGEGSQQFFLWGHVFGSLHFFLRLFCMFVLLRRNVYRYIDEQSHFSWLMGTDMQRITQCCLNPLPPETIGSFRPFHCPLCPAALISCNGRGWTPAAPAIASPGVLVPAIASLWSPAARWEFPR